MESETIKHYIEKIKLYSRQNYERMTRRPNGLLKYPFIVPGSESYSDSLWDWDSWLTDVAVRQIMKDNGNDNRNVLEYEKGCILNFLEHTTDDGWMPICISPDFILPCRLEGKNTNIHKPCLAQHAAFIIQQNAGECSWLEPCQQKLEAYLTYYKNTMFHTKTGLYFWIDDTAIGVDNDPCTFYRPDGSSASIYLNCMMYKELLAMAYISKQMKTGMEMSYEIEAEQLKAAVNEYLWDERNGFYYSADLNLKGIDSSEWLHSGCPRHWDSVIQKIDCWSGFMAMWAGIATTERAKRMVKENMENSELFSGRYGIRTLAKTEKMYCIVKSGNPSCWLGPVWGVSNYICFRALSTYGYVEEARKLAIKTIELFGQDLEEYGEFHEYYDPDTGVGVNNQGFQSWNLLVNNMIAEVENIEVIKEF